MKTDEVGKAGPWSPAYSDAVTSLVPILHNLPGKLVAVDGHPGVGKTTFGRFLAWRFNISLCETDLFLVPKEGCLVHRHEEVSRIVTHRLNRPLPIIVEGCAILRLLSSINRSPDFLIYIINDQAPEPREELASELDVYNTNFFPRNRADLTLTLRDF